MEELKRRGIFAVIVVIVLLPIIGLTAAAGRFPVLLTLIGGVALLYSIYALIKYRLQKRA